MPNSMFGYPRQWNAIARGGIESIYGVYKLHTFKGPGNLVIYYDIPIDILLVGGGGCGGNGIGAFAGVYGGGGGGGGGGALYLSFIATRGTWPVIVGYGGVTGVVSGNSSVFGNIAYGGGNGGDHNVVGSNGGCGGGGGAWNKAGGTGIAGQGYAGGLGDDRYYDGGGGGGAGQIGEAGGVDGVSAGGDGGNGLLCSITGIDTYYGGGGGGGDDGSGGLGGGANGKLRDSQCTMGNTGTNGLGGGGGALRGVACMGGKGGSGIVIVRYVL